MHKRAIEITGSKSYNSLLNGITGVPTPNGLQQFMQFVCVGGSAIWMKAFAQFMHTELGLNESDSDLLDICAGTDRYNMYKTGPAFVHKWLDPGTVVIIGTAVDSFFQPKFEQVVLGKIITRSTELDKDRAQELLNCGSEVDDYPVIIGNTMCTYDFYEGQGHLDGALCSFSNDEKLEYLRKAYKAGVRNIEMESISTLKCCYVPQL